MNARKFILNAGILLCVSFFYSSSFAQVSIGFKGGFNLSNTQFKFVTPQDEKESASYRFYDGIKASIFTEIEFNEHYALAPQYYFIQKGSTARIGHSDSTSNSYISYASKINYLGFGLINKINFYSEDKFQIYGMIGPQFEYAISARTRKMPEWPFTEEISIERLDFDVINLKRYDMNIHTGIGFAKITPRYKLLLEASYDVAFFNISSSSVLPQSNVRNHRNIGIHMGIAFNLATKQEEEIIN